MNVSKINLNGSCIKNIYESLKSNIRSFSNTPEVFNQFKISILLDCDMISLYILSQISSKFQINSEIITTPTDYSNMKIDSVTKSIDALLKVRNSVYEDGYVSNPQVFDNLLPLSSYQYNVSITLSEEGIKSIYHNEIASAFSMSNDSMGNFIVIPDYDIETIKGICASRLNSYVNVMVDKFIHDTTSDINDIISSKYFSIIKNDTDIKQKVYLAGIYGSDCDINFFNVTPSELQKSLSDAHMTNDITATICMRTSFKSFCQIICTSGIKLIGVDKKIGFINSGTDVSEFSEIIASYNTRLVECIAGIKSNIPKLLSSKSKADYRFGFMSLAASQRINYVIDVPYTNLSALKDSGIDGLDKVLNTVEAIHEKYLKTN